MAKNYIKNVDLYDELILSLDNGKLTDKTVKMVMTINERMHRRLSYKYNEDKEDCMSGAIYEFLKYWKNFKPEINNKKTNAFAYITQILKNGSALTFKKLHIIPENDKISITNIYNL